MNALNAIRATTVATLALALALLAPAAAQAQEELEGTWQLQVETTLDGEETPCLYQGQLPLTQNETNWSGPTELLLVSGPAACEGELNGELTGNIEQDGDKFFIDGSVEGTDPTGDATFTGVISDNPGGGGTFAVTQGDFLGEDGTWTAELLQSVLEIPNLGTLGLVVLTALLLAAGAWILARSQPA